MLCTCGRVLRVDLSRWVLDSTRSGSGRKRNLRWQVDSRDDVGDLETAMLVSCAHSQSYWTRDPPVGFGG